MKIRELIELLENLEIDNRFEPLEVMAGPDVHDTTPVTGVWVTEVDSQRRVVLATPERK